MSGAKGQRSAKPVDAPEAFAPGFLASMDRRRAVPRAAMQTMELLRDAVGDPSPQVAVLIEHATWAHLRLRQLQLTYSDCGAFDYKQYAALLNALTGALRSIGLTRVPRPTETLQAYARRIAAEDQSGGNRAA